MIKQFPVNSYFLISHGIQSACKLKSLKPLLRAIELALQLPLVENQELNTIFSCDSFCLPHLATQLRLYNSLASYQEKEISFFNFPISHFITSQPDIKLLEHADNPLFLLQVNNQLLAQQNDYLKNIPTAAQIPSGEGFSATLSRQFEELISNLENKDWEQIQLNDFPFNELSYRDLCLTYKCSPEHADSDKKPFYKHYVQSNKFNLWLLCLLLVEPRIGTSCFCMSFYTASTVFHFFCTQSNRRIRYFGSPSIDLEEFGLCKERFICLTESPLASVNLTKPDLQIDLSWITLSPTFCATIYSIIQKRFNGIGSHTYSHGVNQSSPSLTAHKDWIVKQKKLGKQIIIIFTSSPDESAALQFSFKHLNVDLSHLSNSVFLDQEDWIEHVVSYVSQHTSEYALLIRMHPRLAADKRGLGVNASLPALLSHLNSIVGDNSSIRLVDPADSISSYWLGMQSDLILNGWSTIGLEFAIMGKIVMNAFYKCPVGAGCIYPVHTKLLPLKSSLEYIQRVSYLLQAIRSGANINEEYQISVQEASRAFFVSGTVGLTDLNSASQFYSQLVSPVDLSSQTISIMMGAEVS